MSTNTSPVAGNISTEKVTYRGYAKLDEKGKVDKIQAKAETAKQASWAAMETEEKKKEWSQFNENEFIRYSVKDEDGFKSLVPDPAQRTYIIQAGIQYISNSKINSYMTDTLEDEITPRYNGETIDLKDAINEPPSKRSLTDMEKLERLIASMNLDPASKAALLADVAKRQQVAAASTQQPEEQDLPQVEKEHQEQAQ